MYYRSQPASHWACFETRFIKNTNRLSSCFFSAQEKRLLIHITPNFLVHEKGRISHFQELCKLFLNYPIDILHELPYFVVEGDTNYRTSFRPLLVPFDKSIKERTMSELTVTDLAVEKLKEYMEQNNIDSALRVALMQGGWAGPSLGLALDEPKDNDKSFEYDSLKFLVEESLLQSCGVINVEYVDAGPRSGFGITSSNPIGGGGCNPDSCGSGSCG